MITLKDLNEYKHLKREVADLQRRTRQQQEISDVVRGSSPEPPYTSHPIKITGCDYCCSNKLYQKYTSRAKFFKQKTEEIEDFIFNIDDSLTRQIIRYKCVDELKWREVAQKVGGGQTEESVRKIFVRFMKKQAEKC